jgi:DNA-binding transcriptional regulator YiaG
MRWTVERLKALRGPDRTQAEFATFLGVSVQTIKFWETGRPIPEIVQKLLDRIEREKSLQDAGEPQPA